MRIKQIVETTTAGSVATVAQPMMTQTRENTNVRGLKPVQQVMKGKTPKKGPYANSIVESKVTEDDLAEQDLIVIPGQGRLRRTGFVKHDLDQGEHEGHTLKNSLHTIARAASELDERLSVQSEFPEWVSEKIGAAKGMMVSVMDYLISSQEMQHDPDAMNEGSERVDSIVTDALKVMKGPEVSDAVLALKRVLGDRAYNERRGFYNFYIDQIHKMYNQQSINEGEVSTSNLRTMYDLARMAKTYCDAEGQESLNELLRILKWYMDQAEQGVDEGVVDTIKKVGKALVKPVKDPILNQMKDIHNTVHKREIDAQNKKYAPKGVAEAFDLGDLRKAATSSRSPEDTQALKRNPNFGKIMQKSVDKHNKAVVKTKKDIGSRVADIGPGGKEYNVKTDAAWDAAKKKVSEGAKVDRMVKHVKQSEKKLGHSNKEAENIAWATANKRGMLDNKNKKK